MILLALRPDAVIEPLEPDALLIRHPAFGDITIRDVDRPAIDAMCGLMAEPAELTELVAAKDARLRRLVRWGLIRFACVINGTEVMSAELTSDLADYDLTVDVRTARLRLSRFAVCHRAGEDLVVGSPVAFTRAVIRHPGVLTLLAALTRPTGVATLAETGGGRGAGFVAEDVIEVLRLLVAVGLVGVLDGADQADEDSDPGLRMRELTDVMLHAASRVGLSNATIGGSYPCLGVVPPAPMVKPLPDVPILALPRPDNAKLDAGLADVPERRRSVRRFGRRPLTLDELGGFLFRVARVGRLWEHNLTDDPPYDVSERPYPSAGGAYDLELYLTVLRCAGVRPGIYHYEPVEHGLTLVRDDPKWIVGMLDDANHAVGGTCPLLITLTSRFSRLTWKYRGLAYAATLTNVGVLYAHLYLVATAMDLAPCAIGTGDSALFAKATGIDPAVESSVGEFALGTLPEPD